MNQGCSLRISNLFMAAVKEKNGLVIHTGYSNRFSYSKDEGALLLTQNHSNFESLCNTLMIVYLGQ